MEFSRTRGSQEERVGVQKNLKWSLKKGIEFKEKGIAFKEKRMEFGRI